MTGGSSHTRLITAKPENRETRYRYTHKTYRLYLEEAGDEGGIFHCIDVLQALCGAQEKVVRQAQVGAIHQVGPKTWKWVERNSLGQYADRISRQKKIRTTRLDIFSESPRQTCVWWEYNDGTKKRRCTLRTENREITWLDYTLAKSKGPKRPGPSSLSLGWAGPFDQYHASNAQPHWITEMMVYTKKEPFHAERLLLSNGNYQPLYGIQLGKNGQFTVPIGRLIRDDSLTMDMSLHEIHHGGAQFNRGERPRQPAHIFRRVLTHKFDNL